MENINNKLVTIQATLKAPKNLWNDFSKFKYRSAEGILKAVRPLLQEQGLSLILTDSVETIGDFNYTRSVAEISDGKDKIFTSAYAREPIDKKGMDACQISGAASSYARKYALCGLFALDDGIDSDSTPPDDDFDPKQVLTKVKKATTLGQLNQLFSTIPLKFRPSLIPEFSKRKAEIGES